MSSDETHSESDPQAEAEASAQPLTTPADADEAADLPKARVVKAEVAQTEPYYPVARLIKGAVLEAEDYRAEARQLLESAKAEAERIVHEAKEQAQQELTDARQRGFDEGHGQFSRLIDRLSTQTEQMADRFGAEVTEAAFRVAREILAVELEQNPQSIIQVINTGLHDLRSRLPKRVTVHLHPEDFDLVASHKSEFAGIMPDGAQFGFVKDTNVRRHDVLIETEMGHYDFSVESQLAELRRVIRQRPESGTM